MPVSGVGVRTGSGLVRPLCYDRERTSLDRHATYIVATYIAGAAR